MTADTLGGVWTYALELARALEPFGVRVELAAMGRPPTPAQRAAAARLRRLQLHVGTFRLEWMEDPWNDVARAGDWLLELERRLRPDLVHLNSYAHGALPWTAPALVVGHSCVLSWWLAVKGEPAPAAWDRYRKEVTRGLRAADLIVAPTRAVLTALRELYGPLPPAVVIPNGRDACRFRPGRKEACVFAAGRLWDEAKNVAALAAVAPSLPWPVYVAGEERRPDGGRVEPGAVRRLGLLEEPELAEWLARAAIFAAPARYEPFGLGVLEAALAGCALVLGDVASLRELWGDAALYVPPEECDALREALLALIASPELREHMAARARARAAAYSPGRMARAYVAVYRRLLAGGSGSSPVVGSAPPDEGSFQPPEGREALPCAS